MADYYVNADPAVGDDLAAGSITYPWRTIRKAFGQARVFIATGMCYDTTDNVHMGSTSGTPKQSMIVTAYQAANSPNADYPILECGFFEDALASGWTHVANGIWKKAFGSQQQGRVFVGAYGGYDHRTTYRSIGEAIRRAAMPGYASNPAEATILAAINPSDLYFCGGSATSYSVYIYTGSETVPPPLFYGGLYISGINFNTFKGAASGYSVVNAQSAKLSFLEIRGTVESAVYIRAGSGMAVAQDTADILFSDMKLTACPSGLLTSLRMAGSDLGYRNRGVRCVRVAYDMKTNANEQEPNALYAGISSSGNAFFFGSGTEDCSLYACSSKNAGHKSYYIGDVGFGYDVSPQRCSISYTSAFYDSWTTYSNWVSITDGQGHSMHHSTCDGMTNEVELSGGVHFYKNEATNCKRSIRKPDQNVSALSIETGGYDWNNGLTGGLRYSNSSLVNVVAEQNTFSGRFGNAFKYSLADDYAAQGNVHALFPANKGVIRDNLVVGVFDGDPYGAGAAYYNPRFLVVHDTYPTGFNYQVVSGNVTNIPNPSSSDEIYTDYITDPALGPNADGRVPTAINGMTGSTGNITTDDPKVDAAMNPLASSPLIGTATFIGYGPDIRGVQVSNPPSKGAREYQLARASRV